ncbi:hypothetical protein L21SP3_01509 [Sedimentisphaera cyanobacteriorum]|uniref:Uncharacterized protein n=1 Tax=Sedimentisphaera cyanobacteriorum TaxID=1940790 RepID=A0A1Q2HQH7_9BACT|nr:hypothetical protein [Sedimentisphaera cyanobacteriorum]AQQ09699.1 hypothetical protein L21SP3_01509 [Sedimentisphaera cyanobacteriorum]
MKVEVNFKRYFLYLLRWQLSSPLLAGCLYFLASTGTVVATIISNLIGGLIFFWVDKFIFQSRKLAASWQVEENIKCADCGKVSRGYRLVKAKNYNKSESAPEFRCEECSIKKSKELKDRGVDI